MLRVWAYISLLLYSGALEAAADSCARTLSLLSDTRGRPLTLTITRDNGKRLKLTGAFQIERESRIGITHSANHLMRIEVGRVVVVGPEYRDLRNLTAQLLTWNSGGAFKFAPLEEDEFTCHGSWVFEHSKRTQNGFRGQPLVTQIGGPRIEVANANQGDERFIDYTVNAKLEVATYFDTLDHELEQQGVAVRVKRWFPYNEENPTSAEPVAMMITLKRFIDLAENIQGREEWQIKIPNDLSDAEINSVIRKLIQRAGAKTSKELAVRTAVENERLGIKWMMGKMHIGFLTIDHFGINAHDSSRAHSQLELEMLSNPKVLKKIRENLGKFQRFVSSLRDFVDGKFIGHQPKVRAIAEEPWTRFEPQVTRGSLSAFYARDSRYKTNGFEIFALTPEGEESRHLIELEPTSDFETNFISERRARIQFENGAVFIRRDDASDWRLIARSTGRAISGVKGQSDKESEVLEYKVIELGSLGVGENHSLIVSYPGPPSP